MGKVTKRRGNKLFVQWEGTSFPIEDEMEADEIRLYTSDQLQSLIIEHGRKETKGMKFTDFKEVRVIFYEETSGLGNDSWVINLIPNKGNSIKFSVSYTEKAKDIEIIQPC